MAIYTQVFRNLARSERDVRRAIFHRDLAPYAIWRNARSEGLSAMCDFVGTMRDLSLTQPDDDSLPDRAEASLCQGILCSICLAQLCLAGLGLVLLGRMPLAPRHPGFPPRQNHTIGIAPPVIYTGANRAIHTRPMAIR